LNQDPAYFEERGGPLYLLSQVIVQTINLLIIVSTVALCMESMPRYNPNVPYLALSESNRPWMNTEPTMDGKAELATIWENIELTCVVCFSVDFGVRAFGAAYAKVFSLFYKDLMNWVDLMAILPFYLKIAFDETMDLRYMRVIRLARILRALRSAKFGSMGEIIGNIVRDSAAALAIPIYFMMLAMVLMSSLIYYAEEATEVWGCYPPTTNVSHLPATTAAAWELAGAYERLVGAASGTGIVDRCADCPSLCLGEDCEGIVFGAEGGPLCDISHYELYDHTVETLEHGPMFASIPHTFWWCIVTFTTVGYGDMYPRTGVGRLLGTATMFMGIFFIAMPLTIVGASFSNSWDRIKNQTEEVEIGDREGGLDREEVDNDPVGELHTDIDAHMARLLTLLQRAASLREVEDEDGMRQLFMDTKLKISEAQGNLSDELMRMTGPKPATK
jgi:hypothetical protein